MLVTWEAKVSFIFGPVASCVFAFFSRLERNLFGAADSSAFFLLLGGSAWPVADSSAFCSSFECFSEASLTLLTSSCYDISSESSLSGQWTRNIMLSFITFKFSPSYWKLLVMLSVRTVKFAEMDSANDLTTSSDWFSSTWILLAGSFRLISWLGALVLDGLCLDLSDFVSCSSSSSFSAFLCSTSTCVDVPSSPIPKLRVLR